MQKLNNENLLSLFNEDIENSISNLAEEYKYNFESFLEIILKSLESKKEKYKKILEEMKNE